MPNQELLGEWSVPTPAAALSEAFEELSRNETPEELPFSETPDEEPWGNRPPKASERMIINGYQRLADEFALARQNLDQWSEESEAEYSRDTLNRAIQFLEGFSTLLWTRTAIICPVPAIGPGPDGSVDIYWKRPASQLLVNIPAAKQEKATYFGSNYEAQKSKGSFSPDSPIIGLAIWLM